MKQWRLKAQLTILFVFFATLFLILGTAFHQTTPAAESLLSSLSAVRQASSSRASSAQNAPPQQPGAENFVGADTCRACHPDQYLWLSATAHFATIKSPKYVPPVKGCEMCHGPGRQHVQASGQGHIFNPAKSSAREVVAMCATCHQEKRAGKCGFHQNQHDVDAVSCNDCHNPHQEVTHKYILRSEPPKLCYDCHRDIRAEFSRPFHHKVPEGGMICRDCHEQHSSFNITQAVDILGGRDALCLRCHADKEGPFVFEHITLRSDRCLACHVPHGSINNRMLVRSEVKSLCQECHGDRQGASADVPQGFHDLTSPRYQNCTSCHVMIHGSNTNRLFLR
jgi:DmsE family decaheme c-type cytochrome